MATVVASGNYWQDLKNQVLGDLGLGTGQDAGKTLGAIAKDAIGGGAADNGVKKEAPQVQANNVADGFTLSGLASGSPAAIKTLGLALLGGAAIWFLAKKL